MMMSRKNRQRENVAGASTSSHPFNTNNKEDKPKDVTSVDKHFDQKRADSGSILFGRLPRNQIVDGVSPNSEKGRNADILQEKMTSSSGVGNWKDSGEFVSDSSSILSFHPWIFRKDNYQVDRENMVGDGEFYDKYGFGMVGNGEFYDKYGFGMDNVTNNSLPLLSPRNVDIRHGFRRQKSSIRSRRNRYSIKPLHAQNCLVPQLYGEIEEFVFSPMTSPHVPSRRSFVITDGSQVISKSSCEPPDSYSEMGLCKGHNAADLRAAMIGISPLPQSRKPKRKSEQMHQGCDASTSRGSHNGSYIVETVDGLLLFCMGISVGVALTMVTKRKEVEKLNDMLKQSENLVQDLQEELELKDSLTVKELVNESSGSLGHTQAHGDLQEPVDSFDSLAFELHSIKHDKNVIFQPNSNKVEKDSESLSKIEAELEAELERLELNMSASSLEGKMSVMNEFNDDLIANVVQGELREDKLRHQYEGQDESCCNSKGGSTTRTPPPNYSVSPRELSLRLHELNQARLEERIRELEAALGHSQRHLRFMEAEKVHSLNSNSDMGSSNQGSPVVIEHGEAMTQPLCINLAGNALDAYHEAYDEFMRITEIDKKSPSTAGTNEKIHEEELYDSDGGLSWDIEGDQPEESSFNFKSPFEEKNPTASLGSDGVIGADDEEDGVDGIDDEESRILIQQIVERTRKGSPLVLNVQRMLLSMDYK